MRFWGIFSKTFFRIAAPGTFQKLKADSIENVLKKSIRMVDLQTFQEMKDYLKSKQNSDGGFADRGGKSDLYYSLFGCYVAEALGADETIPSLKEFVKKYVNSENLTGIHLTCALILYSKLFGASGIPSDLRKPNQIQAKYSGFIKMLAFYYADDYAGLYKVQREMKSSFDGAEMPCSVTAARVVINDCFGKPTSDLIEKLNVFYRKNGSYSAVKGAPSGDLLSTGVALYALRFANTDLRIIKPDSLAYIDSLYSDGGFCAAPTDPNPDVEYTFYGLLALGSLSD
jgi:hypothetical protein